MPNPPAFVPGFSYSGYQANNPTLPLPGPMVDNDFANVSDSLNTTITALGNIRRSDGALANGIVTLQSLASDLTIGVQTPTAWVTAHAYAAGNIVVQSNKFYLCLVAHTSGVFATDLAAVKWVEVTLSISGYSADQVIYDHTISGLVAVNVKTALDEIDAKVDALQAATVFTGTFIAPAGAVATPSYAFTTGATSGLSLSNDGFKSVVISADGLEVCRATITAFTVGKVSGDLVTAGSTLYKTGLVQATVDGNIVSQLNRLTTDGVIVEYMRAGVAKGSVSIAGAVTSFNTSSDINLKTNWRSFDSGAIVDAIETWLFDWKEGGSAYGVLAQDVFEVFPDAVTPGETWQVDYSKFVPLLLAEVKDLRRRLAAAGL